MSNPGERLTFLDKSIGPTTETSLASFPLRLADLGVHDPVQKAILLSYLTRVTPGQASRSYSIVLTD